MRGGPGTGRPALRLARRVAGADRVEPELLDDVVRDLNRIDVERGLETARALGTYVVDRLFGGDLAAFRNHAPTHATWRALAGHPELNVSHSTLWSAVRVLEQLRELPTPIGYALSVSHHRRLFVVTDPRLKNRLAREAVTTGMTVRELEERVASLRAATPGPRRGRPSLPPPVRAIRGLTRHTPDEAAFTEDALASLDPDDLQGLLTEVDAHLERLVAIRRRLSTARRSGAPPATARPALA